MTIALFNGWIMSIQSRSSRDGFSLIELLIVVAIIGLVTAIAVPNLIKAIQRSALIFARYSSANSSGLGSPTNLANW
ncbi:MAG: type IV pilin protein [Thermoanaerobaculales bacterium]